MKHVRFFCLRGIRVFVSVYRAHAVGSLWGQDVVCRSEDLSLQSGCREDTATIA